MAAIVGKRLRFITIFSVQSGEELDRDRGTMHYREKGSLPAKKGGARFIKPPNFLKQKVGSGGLPPEILTKSQKFIEENPVDFTPFAKEYLVRLQGMVKDIKAGRLSGEEAIDSLTVTAMQLKANGGMFGYHLLSEVGDVLLNFLENIVELNAEAVSVIEAHLTTMHVILANMLRGDGGQEGLALSSELYQACRRYFKKYEVEDSNQKSGL